MKIDSLEKINPLIKLLKNRVGYHRYEDHRQRSSSRFVGTWLPPPSASYILGTVGLSLAFVLVTSRCSHKDCNFKTRRHKGNPALFLAYFLAIFWHMPGFISGMCQKFYCTILCSQISPKFLAYYRAIIPLWLGTRLGTYFSRDVASHSTSRKNFYVAKNWCQN